MKFKKGLVGKGWAYPAVSLIGLDWPHMQQVMEIVEMVYQNHGYEPVCSCGTEIFKFRTDTDYPYKHLIHSIRSLHYCGRALDFSCSGIPVETTLAIRKELIVLLDRISRWYDVVYHSRSHHFHIEWDEK